jgi:WD40 repeat protein
MYLEGKGSLLGLANLVSHGAVDDESGLLFVGDSTRIKSYSWWDSVKNTKVAKLLPTHTLDSKGFGNAIGILPNGRVARAGDGKIGIWNLNELPTHQTTQGLIGGNIAEDDEDLDTWRDDPERIERSSGSLPHVTITLGEAPFNVSIWQNHPSMPGTILAANNCEKNDQYYFRALDLENNGKCTMRYLGHGGAINQLSTSKGDPNVLVTAAADGLARLYDVRQPLPVLTIQAGTMLQNCSSAVVCHPDGIPCRSTSVQAKLGW